MNTETASRILNKLKATPGILPPDVELALDSLLPIFDTLASESAEKRRRCLFEEVSLRTFVSLVTLPYEPSLHSEDATVRQLAAQAVAERANELALQWLLAFEAVALAPKEVV